MNSQARPPVIGINGLLVPDEVPYLKVPKRYADAILRAGGLPFTLPAVGGPLDIDPLLDRVDGLLLIGGDDFEMERLGLGPTHPAADKTPGEKQDWDFELAKRALARGLPTLGVCYGMQVLGLAEGGTLLQHLPEDRPEGQNHSGNVLHEVALESGTKLHSAFDLDRVEVVSQHHQALGDVGPLWRVTARDEEGLIEGIERRDHPYALGVQWHPEKAYEGSPHDRLFRSFVSASGWSAQRSSSLVDGGVG